MDFLQLDNNAEPPQDPLPQASTSRYFVTTPSSPFGSVKSFGSFISSLEQLSPSQPHPSAVGPFRCCPIFRSSYERLTNHRLGSCGICGNNSAESFCPVKAGRHDTPLGSSDFPPKKSSADRVRSCERRRVDVRSEETPQRSRGEESELVQSQSDEQLIEWAIKASVRHLCPSRCFFKAHTAVQNWTSLRAKVASSDYPDELLHGWRCRLVMSSVEGDVASECSSGSFRTVFVAPDGEEYRNEKEVLRRLGRCDGSHQMHASRPRGRLASSRLSTVGKVLPLCFVKSEPIFATHPGGGRKRKHQQADVPTCVAFEYWLAGPPSSLGDQIGGSEFGPIERMTLDLASPFGLLEELFSDDPWKLILSTIFLNRTSRAQVDNVLFEFLRQWPNAQSAATASSEDIASVISSLGFGTKRSQAIVRFSKEYIDLVAFKSERSDCASPANAVGVSTSAASPLPGRSDKGQDESLSEPSVDGVHSIHSNDAHTQLKHAVCVAQRDESVFRRSHNLSDKEVLSLYNCGRYAVDAYNIFIRRRLVAPRDHALLWYVDYQRGRIAVAKKVLTK